MDPLFGSEVRARVLEQLAKVPGPQTAYRIARSIGAEPIQVLKILKQLTTLTEQSASGWILRDDLLRRFIRRYSRRRELEIRREKDELLLRYGMRPSWEHLQRRLQASHISAEE